MYDGCVAAVGYVRVSTEKQADVGISLEAQTEKIHAMAVVQGLELSEIIIDAGESAKTLSRPGMERLLQLVDAGAVDSVIVAKLDRLTRSLSTATGRRSVLPEITRLGAQYTSSSWPVVSGDRRPSYYRVAHARSSALPWR